MLISWLIIFLELSDSSAFIFYKKDLTTKLMSILKHVNDYILKEKIIKFLSMLKHEFIESRLNLFLDIINSKTHELTLLYLINQKENNFHFEPRHRYNSIKFIIHLCCQNFNKEFFIKNPNHNLSRFLSLCKTIEFKNVFLYMFEPLVNCMLCKDKVSYDNDIWNGANWATLLGHETNELFWYHKIDKVMILELKIKVKKKLIDNGNKHNNKIKFKKGFSLEKILFYCSQINHLNLILFECLKMILLFIFDL